MTFKKVYFLRKASFFVVDIDLVFDPKLYNCIIMLYLYKCSLAHIALS